MNRQFSAGGLVYKKEGDVVRWLVRRPTPNPEFHGNLGWSFPKGWLDDTDGGLKPGPLATGQMRASEEEIQMAALREVCEEGGVIAKVVKKLPAIKVFFKNDQELVMKYINYYAMEYLQDAPEGHDAETAETRWVTRDEAMELLAFKNEKELLNNAINENYLEISN